MPWVRSLLPLPSGPVAQSVRALACHARGRGFEPHPGRQFAVVAQQAEHFLGKEEVDSSNLFNSSTLFVTVKWVRYLFNGVFLYFIEFYRWNLLSYGVMVL